jgi:HEAT repeat protein
MILMENLYQWNRDDKLFAIRAMENAERNDAQYLLQLIVDDDPVVRGKAALAMENCTDETLMEAVDTLLEQDESETTILACELLGFTDSVDFTGKLRPLLTASDDRVVRSAIEVSDQLPEQEAIDLLKELVSRYDENWSKSLKRVLGRFDSPDLLDVLQPLYQRVDNTFRVELLGIGATLGTEEAWNWVTEKLETIEVSKSKRTVIQWLMTPD